MRVNVYSQEITEEVVVVETESNTGKKYPGVRFMLHSSEKLHHRPDDDDRSAVTFWFHDHAEARNFFGRALKSIESQVP